MIRAATIADVPQLIELGAAMHAEAPNFAQLPFNGARLESTLCMMIADAGSLVAVAERDGRIDGVMLAIAGLHWASDAVEVDELAFYVTPEARGSLLACSLIRQLQDFARAKGARVIRAGTAAGVNSALVVGLYERAGFRVIGTDLQFIVQR